MARTETLHGRGWGIDTRDYRQVAKACRVAAPVAAKALRKQLREAGEVVAAEARTEAARHSTRIAPTIKVRVSSTTVAVVAGSADVPIAALFERGNRRSSPNATTFRHPVFGNKNVWVQQPKHPFLRPAADAKRTEVLHKVELALDEAVAVLVAEATRRSV